MRARSIRTRLVVGMVLLVSAGLLIANTSGILLLGSYLVDRADSQLNTIARTAEQNISPPDSVDFCADSPDPRGLRTDFIVVVLDSKGNVACSPSPDLGNAAPAFDSAELATADGPTTMRSRDGSTRWRVRTVDEAGAGQTIVLAVSLADAEATVSRMIRLSLVVSTLVLLLTAAAAWMIARIGLQPLAQIEATAERIAAGDLTERVPVFRRRTEVGRLAAALNGMLSQIERAFTARTESEARLRRFVSDASHELRTPVAAIRGHAEMWRAGVSRDLDTIMTRIESESKRMGDLVDDMLLLARLDQSRPLEQRPVDLLSIAIDAVVDARALQPERMLTLDVHPGTDPPVIIGDEARLRQILANLLTNALVHTPVTSAVEVQVRTSADHVELAVVDAGPGMPRDVVSNVFDRFYRADTGRGRDHGGSGLGLAIVRSIAEAHGGVVTCTSTIERGSTFVLRLPAPREHAAL